MRKTILSALVLTIAMMVFAGCSTEPKTDAGKETLSNDSVAAFNDFKVQDPSLGDFLQPANAYGYAIFPSIGKGAVGVGGAYGKGEVFEQGNAVGYCDMTQGSIGLALGGQDYSELLVFQTKDALERFKAGNFTLAAQASAVAAKSGAAASAKYDNGIAVFVKTSGGLMGEASIGGQNFTYTPMQ
jgi:lipid-binding SYLF domain-containing protein